jgi:geranylgeranyl pyrophosphate synthase
MYFFERANPADATYVKGVVENSEATDNEIERAVSLIGASGAFETAFDEAKDFILRAKEVLDTVPDSESKSRLLQIADYALQREK